jgi:pimeloyl-ACP methyl ester carboxylesterase
VIRRLTGRARESDLVWYYRQSGSGRPLILLHGIGMSHAAWNAVVPHLESSRRVIAFDIAGFGRSPSLPTGELPTITRLVDALAQSLCNLGIHEPVDIAGNSLGGCMALEAAKQGLARSVVAISPIGLWMNGPAPHVQYTFRLLRWMATRCPRLLEASTKHPWMREVALAVPMSAGSRRMPAADATRAVRDLAASTAFEATFKNTQSPFAGLDISVPVTVVFGGCDWILTPRARRREALPAHTRWVEKKSWGHVPMWADPEGVAQLILQGTGLDSGLA